MDNDSDADGDTLTVNPPTAASLNGGTISTNATNNGINYTPPAGFRGIDSFIYAANDGMTNSNIVTVSIQVTGSNGQIVFTSSRDGNNEIYAMNADGTGQTRPKRYLD